MRMKNIRKKKMIKPNVVRVEKEHLKNEHVNPKFICICDFYLVAITFLTCFRNTMMTNLQIFSSIYFKYILSKSHCFSIYLFSPSYHVSFMLF